MRFKNRYVLFELIAAGSQSDALTAEELTRALQASADETVGAVGAARIFSSFKIVYCNAKANYFAARVAKSALSDFLFVLFFITAIGGRSARFRLLKASGTVKKMEEALLMLFKTSEHRGLRRLAAIAK